MSSESLGCPVCGKPRDRDEAMAMLRIRARRGDFSMKTYDFCDGCEDRMETITKAVFDSTVSDEEHQRQVSRSGRRLVDLFLDD